MSALGLASLGVHCQNKALGMSSLGVFCDGEIVQPEIPTPSGDFLREIDFPYVPRRTYLSELLLGFFNHTETEILVPQPSTIEALSVAELGFLSPAPEFTGERPSAPSATYHITGSLGFRSGTESLRIRIEPGSVEILSSAAIGFRESSAFEISAPATAAPLYETGVFFGFRDLTTIQRIKVLTPKEIEEDEDVEILLLAAKLFWEDN